MKKFVIEKLLSPVILIILWFVLMFVFANTVSAQVVGKTQTEQYKASFETNVSIDSLMDYDGPQIPIQILKIDSVPL